jgi:hypothetical protein
MDQRFLLWNWNHWSEQMNDEHLICYNLQLLQQSPNKHKIRGNKLYNNKTNLSHTW